jgi:hypothetical protein
MKDNNYSQPILFCPKCLNPVSESDKYCRICSYKLGVAKDICGTSLFFGLKVSFVIIALLLLTWIILQILGTDIVNVNVVLPLLIISHSILTILAAKGRKEYPIWIDYIVHFIAGFIPIVFYINSGYSGTMLVRKYL